MYLQLKTRLGECMVVGFSETSLGVRPGNDYETGNVDVSSVLDANTGVKDWIWTGTPANGATDGTISQDFKEKRYRTVKALTEKLILRGFDHAPVSNPTGPKIHFNLTREDQINSMALNMQQLSGDDMSLYDFDEYVFESTVDFNTWYSTVMTQKLQIIEGKKSLRSAITAADNTQEAMDAIVDNRTYSNPTGA